MKTLVIYVYHTYNDRVRNFIKNAIFLDRNIDFMIINNDCNVPITLPDYVMYFKTTNLPNDFDMWSKGLLYNNLYKDYDSFIFVNSSAMGPYLPSYFKGKWTDVFIEGLTDSVKLFGCTINTGKNDPEVSSYLQSYVFSLDLEALTFLISKEIFSLSSYLVDNDSTKEFKMSRHIIENNWNIGCMMEYYKDLDFRFLASRPSDYKPFLGDVMIAKNFSEKLFGNFYELIFVNGTQFDFNIHGIKSNI